MNEIQLSISRHLKAVFNLPDNVSHDRLSLVLGEPDVRARLSVRLLKNWDKYKEHFGEYPELFTKLLEQFFGKDIYGEVNYKDVSNKLFDESLKEKGEKYTVALLQSCCSEVGFPLPTQLLSACFLQHAEAFPEGQKPDI